MLRSAVAVLYPYQADRSEASLPTGDGQPAAGGLPQVDCTVSSVAGALMTGIRRHAAGR